MIKKLMIAAALLSSTPATAREAATDDGNELYGYCTDDGYFLQGMCLGYIRGTIAMFSLSAELNKTQNFCIPSSVTTGQTRDVVVQYMRRNASQRHYPSAGIIMLAINEAWPCRAS